MFLMTVGIACKTTRMGKQGLTSDVGGGWWVTRDDDGARARANEVKEQVGVVDWLVGGVIMDFLSGVNLCWVSWK